ncbi:MAG: glycosyltransferase family 2 protein [Chloroflexota bacterium]
MNDPLPTVSVVVLNYNGLAHLEPCFRSLLALDYPADRLELMLVDNGSTDGSAAWMRTHFPAVRIVETGANLGFAGGNNAGARAARGEIVAFLNNDMRVAAGWLAELAAPFAGAPDVAAVGARILDWDGARVDFADGGLNFCGYGYQFDHGRRAVAEPGEVRPQLYVCGGALAVRRELFLAWGGFDEDFFAFYEDTDLGWRFWVLGYRLLLAPRAVVYHRGHGTAGRLPGEKRRLLYERNALLSAIKNYERENLDRILPAALLLLLQRAWLASGVDEGSFRIGGPPPRPARSPDDDVLTARYYLRRVWQTLRAEGLNGLWETVQGELAWRTGGPLLSGLRRRKRPSASGEVAVSKESLAHLVAANDVLALLPRAMEKRARIQAARRRPDAEIFPLFRRPLELSLFTPEYKQAQAAVVDAFELASLFGESS